MLVQQIWFEARVIMLQHVDVFLVYYFLRHSSSPLLWRKLNFIIHGKNNFAILPRYLLIKIYLDTDLEIILSDNKNIST